MDKNVAGLKICSTELTEVTKDKKNLIACILKTVHTILHVPMGDYIGKSHLN